MSKNAAGIIGTVFGPVSVKRVEVAMIATSPAYTDVSL